MIIRESLVRALNRLSESGTTDPEIEAETLLRHVLGMDRARFFASLHEQMTPDDERSAARLLDRRLESEPLAYILGRREFYGLDFAVDPNVLIPRQETELLVDKTLEVCSRRGREGGLAVADVGTGCGALAIAIVRNLPEATLYATDIRPEALAVAEVNRRIHSMESRVTLRQGDLLEALQTSVDVIVSNPPYLRSADIDILAPEIRAEPRWALDGGADGLQITSRLLIQASSYLRPNGCILIEISPEQLERVTQIAHKVFSGAGISFDRDLLGHPRVVTVDLNVGRERPRTSWHTVSSEFRPQPLQASGESKLIQEEEIVVAEEQLPDSESRISPGHAPEQRRDIHANESPGYDAVIRLYGEAMMRIGELEAQMFGVERRVTESENRGASSSDFAELAEKVEALERRWGTSAGTETSEHASDTRPISAEDDNLLREREEEISQLRLQVNSLTGQLAQTQEQLKSSQGTRARRRSRRRDSPPKWKFWQGSRRRWRQPLAP